MGSAQYIVGPFGPESNLRVHGMSIAARGGKNAKKRAVLMHRLWVTQNKYQPFYGMNKKAA